MSHMSRSVRENGLELLHVDLNMLERLPLSKLSVSVYGRCFSPHLPHISARVTGLDFHTKVAAGVCGYSWIMCLDISIACLMVNN